VKVVRFIDEAERCSDEAAETIRSQIKAQQDLRSTLIAHAVTGRIRVY